MKSKYLIRVAGIGATCLAATAMAGLPWADASPNARVADAAGTTLNCVHFDSDDPAVCGIMRRGPEGPRGPRGYRGFKGATGKTGPAGLQGPRGVGGRVGPQGNQGPQGLQGVQGAPGHTVVVAGTPVTVTAPSGGEPQGTELTPSVATCTSTNVSSTTPEAYGGGVQIQKSGTESSGDIVAIQQQYLGTYVSSTSVTLPTSSPSTAPPNAYEGQAVVTQLTQGDTVTVQAFVICGP